MVDQSVALQIKPPGETDLSTTMLRAYQAKQAQTNNDLAQLRIQGAQQGMAEHAQKTQALETAAKEINAGNPNGAQSLTQYPELQSQVFQNMDKMRGMRIQRMADAASVVAPLVGTEGFKDAWRRELDGLYRAGDLPKDRYESMRDNPSELALQQVMALSGGLENYQKAEHRKAATTALKTISSSMGENNGPGGVPADPYSVSLMQAESGGRNIPTTIKDANGEPVSSARGPMQFLTGTWNDIISRHKELGYKPEDIDDPNKQAVAERIFRQENAQTLAKSNIVPSDRNLRMAHWLGAGGATQFLKAMEQNPDAPAVNFMGEKAASNHRNIIYSPSGAPLSLRQVYNKQTAAFGDGTDGIAGLYRTPSGGGGSGGAVSTNDKLVERLPELIKIATLGGLEKQEHDAVMTLIKEGLDQNKPTTLIKNYNDYLKRYARGEEKGPKLSQVEYSQVAGDAPRTTINTGDNVVQSTMGKEFIAAQQASVSAARDMVQYEMLNELLRDPAVYTGTGADLISRAKHIGSTLLGLNLEGVAGPEVARRITAKLALDVKESAGKDPSTSVYERKIYESIPPNIGDSPKGRELVVQLAAEDANHKRDVAAIWAAHNDGSKFDPKVYPELQKLEVERRKKVSNLVRELREVIETIPQASPLAGTNGVLNQLREKYNGLEMPQ